jgi:hypothetical protein
MRELQHSSPGRAQTVRCRSRRPGQWPSTIVVARSTLQRTTLELLRMPLTARELGASVSMAALAVALIGIGSCGA